MRGITNVTMVLISLLLAASPVFAAGDTFYEKNSEGWFFYEPIPDETEIKPDKNPDPKPEPEPVVKMTTPAETIVQGPEPMSTAWIRENFQSYVDKAIDVPSSDNVRAVMYLQRVMLDKSTEFADATQKVVIGDPFLDEISRRPIASYGANKASKFAKLNQEELIIKLAESAGIYFIYSSTCKFCVAQAPVLRALERKYGLKVLPISIDGAPLPTGDYPEFKVDNGQAQTLGVQKTPALFLVKPELGFPNGFAPISQGVISMAEAENRIVLSALNAGWINDSEYNETRPVDASINASNNLDMITNDALNDPERLVSILRERLKKGGND